MKILIDIGHPGHVHLFRPFAKEMIKRGHQCLFTCRKKEFEIELLEKEQFSYISFGSKYKSTIGKIFGMLKFDFKMLRVAIHFKPDIFLSAGSMYAAQVSFLLRKPHITFEDTGNMEQIRLYLPFTDAVLTSDVFHKKLGAKQIIYSGYHELAYLHPKVFTPNSMIKEELRFLDKEKAVLLRFVSWNASHDRGQGGFSLKDKLDLVQRLEKKYKVFISSESELPSELEKYRLKTKPERIHDVMSVVDLFIGEGATMASECAVLGTPAIYVNTMEAGSIDDQEKHGLLYHFRNYYGIVDKAKEILENPKASEIYSSRRDFMLSQKINVTSFLIWFVSNWPNSYSKIKDSPNFQYNFK
jgi:predicted glycosyltransferase